MSNEIIEIKPTKLVMSLCDEMFERKSRGQDYPAEWNTKTRQKLEAAGLVELKGKTDGPKWGNRYYFTEAGLAWYLTQRPEKRLSR